ncbi:MAG TPA: hypothetical protein P5167_02285 [Bacteroidales bacterium]|nr:hypothetical protein [Bacteroidales bacterium]
MKTQKGVLTVLVVIVSLAAGFLIGILVDLPKTDNTELSGTIGRVRNYKNVKITEEDIELKNQLTSDTLILKAISNYFNYYYVSAVSQGEKIRYTLDNVNPLKEFREFSGLVLTEFENYGTFLGNARKDLLLAAMVCNEPEDANPVMMRNTITQANNVISQMHYRKQTVLNFLENVEAFLEQNKDGSSQALADIHLVLTMDQLANAMALNDKMVIKYFEKKKLFTEEIQGSFSTDLKGIITSDVNSLGTGFTDKTGIENFPIIQDASLIGRQFILGDAALGSILDSMSELGYYVKNANTLANMQELSMGGIMIIMDAAGELGVMLNTNDLGGYVIITDQDNLGTVWDAQKLGSVLDAQKLGFFNMTQLNDIFFNASELGMVTGLNPNWPPKVF